MNFEEGNQSAMNAQQQQQHFGSYRRANVNSSNTNPNQIYQQTLSPPSTNHAADSIDETELEAIELIQGQVLQIKTLKDQIVQKEETIDNLRIQNKQIDAYKQQIQNLKQQIALFEERFKYYEEDRMHYEKRLQSQTFEGDQKTHALMNEIDDMNHYLAEYRKQKEDDGLQIQQLMQQVDQKERLYVCIKEQVESLGKQLETLQISMHEREEASVSKISGLKKEVKLNQKEKKLLEQRIKELSDLIQSKQQDSLNQSKIVTDKDQMIKKLRDDIHKIKRDKEDINQKRLQLEQRMPQLEQNLLDLNRIVERCQKDIDKEAIKKENLLQENQELRQSLVHFQEIYQDLEITDPLQFKNEIDKTRDEIHGLRSEMMEKQKFLKAKEDQIMHRDQEIKEQRQDLQREIKSVAQWVAKNINAKAISEQEDLEITGENEDELNNQNDLNISYIDPIILKEFQKLRNLLINQKTQVQQKFFKQQQRQENLQNELKDAQKIKQEILEDFKRLKSSIKQSEVLTSQNDEFKSELHKILDQNNNLKEQIQSLESETQKFSIEMYNILYNIRHKFENNQRINTQLDMSLRYNFTSERFASIAEIATMIGDITNILNFELKNLEIKDQQYQELLNSYEELKMKSIQDLKHNEELRHQELQELQVNFEKKYQRFKEYQMDIEKINLELQQQIEVLRNENIEKQRSELQVNSENQNMALRLSELQELETRYVPSLLIKIEELIFQKTAVMKELKFIQNQFSNTQKAQKYMYKKTEKQIVGDELLNEHMQKTGNFGSSGNIKQNNRYKDESSSLSNIYSPDTRKKIRKIQKELAFPSVCLKFRKYVIVVICALRLQKLSNLDTESKLRSSIQTTPADLIQLMINYNLPVSDNLSSILQDLKTPSTKSKPILSVLSYGIRNLRNQIQTHTNHHSQSSTFNIDYSQLSFDMQYLFSTFKPKEFYNRHLLKLEGVVDKQKAAALLISQQNQQYEIENKKINEKLFQIQQELVQSYQTCEKYGMQVQELQRELGQSVSKDEFHQLKDNYDQIGKDFYDTRDNFRRVNEKMERLVREKDELAQERKQHMQQIIEQEQNLQDKLRDLELKDVKIQSMESILQKRDMSIDFSSNNINKFEDKIRGLEMDKEKLIKDNVTLIRENEYLKEQINTTIREEQEKFRSYNEERSNKQEEIQRLLETNLQTLEDRCQLLEQQIDSLRKDKQELMARNAKLMMYEQKENDSLQINKFQFQEDQYNPNIVYQNTMRSPTFQNLHQEGYQIQSQQFNFDQNQMISSQQFSQGALGSSNYNKYQTLQSTNSMLNLGVGAPGGLANQTSHFKSLGSDSGNISANMSGQYQLGNRESPSSKIPGKITKTKNT
ncbi:UNKNOWN [Stylonychia lemnae]|uniref:Uncharacterized protein n=1 Tax=Stylonychia lemnae TaxID=5949 RepID=A0A077ZPD0_STYLE|nr:UNKNOWN [Stylonychia lemnae]|eukprot:CDW71802.1 UNKNOWN [Stylonychia lemnae]